MPARFLGFCCLLFGVVAWSLQPTFAAEPRIALVIGNSDYGPAIGKLKNPANDAKLMADTLKGLGFSVHLALDADQKAMKRAVKGFGAKLREAGPSATGLFYYAGHGVQVEGENFLLPVGAEIEAEADVEIESIAAADVMSQMESAGNRVNLVFLDACRNNPLAKASRSGTRGLARLDAPHGSFVGYSTAPGDVAADGDGINSPYALALADELKKPGISVEEAHRNVRARVLAQTGDKQTPWDSSSLTGAVILQEKVPDPAPQAAALAPAFAPQSTVQQQAAVDKEVVFWESVKDSKEASEFEAYLQQYPDGSFAPLAKAKVAKLRTLPAPAPAGQSTQRNTAQQATAEPSVKGSYGTIKVTAQMQDAIAEYLRKAGDDTRWAALAIAADGSSIGTTFCKKDGAKVPACIDGIRNNPTTQAQTNKAALKDCGASGKCILLYEGDRKIAGIELVTQ